MSKIPITVNPDTIHSAITTWSGFVYQGKVALYHVIKLLTSEDKSTAYSLQLDSLEDFAIMDAPDSCISLHQVKALKADYYSTYSSEFAKLCSKSKTYDCDNINFHVAVEIRDKSIVEVEAAHNGMKMYKYNNGLHYCLLKDIDTVLDQAILEFYKKRQGDLLWKTTDDYIKITRNILDNEIQGKVISIHQRVHQSLGSDNENAFKQTIPFTIFENLLSLDLNIKTTNEDYFLALLKTDLNTYYQDFCFNCPEPVGMENELKMDRFICFINKLDKVTLVRFLRRIVPHRKIAFSNISQYKDNTFHKDEMKDAFFKTLYELTEIENIELEIMGWSVDTENFLVPTSISRHQDAANEVCGDIVQNIMEIDIDIPYQTSSLITSNMNVSSIYNMVNHIMDIPEEGSLNKDQIIIELVDGRK